MKKLLLFLLFFNSTLSMVHADHIDIEVPYGFFEIINEELLADINSQFSKDAYLLAVFAPETIKQSIESGNFEHVTRLVYIYESKENFPIGALPLNSLDKTIPILGIEAMAKSYSKIYDTYEKTIPFTPANRDLWEKQLQEFAIRGESILLHQSEHDADTQYNYIIMQNFNTSPNTFIQCLIATSLLLNDEKVYYVSASSFVYSSNFYNDMEWIVQTMRSFLPEFPIL